jgi:hypothetical protein
VITTDDATSDVVSTRLDYCNSLFYSCEANIRVQNSLARLVFGWNSRSYTASTFAHLYAD